MNNYNQNTEILTACRNACQKVVAQIANVKESFVAQFRELVADHEKIFQLALNEAEALAWQSEYPQLVFQDLAEEKARNVVNWIAHQKSVRPNAHLKM